MNDFFEKAIRDKRILISHISLFAAICRCWHKGGFVHPVAVTRRQLMILSKIASFATYHKCMKELDSFGYLSYLPSYKPSGSLICWTENEPKQQDK